MPSLKWPPARDLALLALTKTVLSLAVLAGGFRAISDDDFSRIALAQEWAQSPRLDPTGTSWLPLPFWIYGTVMKLVSPSLETALATALVLGVASAIVLYFAARIMVGSREALAAAFVAAVIPWSAWLGAAAVPELPTAALTVFAVATLVQSDVKLRSAGALALLAATLSRYEPWLVAGCFAAFCLRDAARWRDRRGSFALLAVLALSGPMLWVLHNWGAHGDGLHFLHRVSAFKRALGGGSDSPWYTLSSYSSALLRQEPEVALLAAAFALTVWRRARTVGQPASRVVVTFALLLGGLSIAALGGGAPTHHPGRALLSIWLAAGIYVGATARTLLRQPAKRRRLFAWLFCTVLASGVLVLRPWYARRDVFEPRRDSIAIGRAVASQVPNASRILLQANDYGFFAVQAASGRPGDFVIDRSVDPRRPGSTGSFTSRQRLHARVHETRCSHIVAEITATTLTLGPPLARAGKLGLWPATAANQRSKGPGSERAIQSSGSKPQPLRR